jgi:hypothetical protein
VIDTVYWTSTTFADDERRTASVQKTERSNGARGRRTKVAVEMVYCNDRDRERYEEINHLSDWNDEDRNIPSMIGITDDCGFSTRQ